jgi:Ca2+-binding EF-hand superfamily protein
MMRPIVSPNRLHSGHSTKGAATNNEHDGRMSANNNNNNNVGGNGSTSTGERGRDDDLSLCSADFELARETFHDERVSTRQSNRSRRLSKDDIVDMLEFDNSSKHVSMTNNRNSTIRERTLKVKNKAQRELASIKNTVRASVVDRSHGVDPEYAKEINDHMEDLRQEQTELWCKKHGNKYASMKNSDKRDLRVWFNELSHSSSGEVNADELQDPMISFGVLRTREQVVRLLNNIDRNGNAGIDFDEFLLALNSKDSNNIRSLKRMQEAHVNVDVSVNTLITAERRKKLFDSVVKASEKRNRELEFAFFRMNQHGNRRSEDANSKTWSTLEAKHHRNMRLHNKYIDSLNNVVQSKIRQMNHISEHTETEKKREQQECVSLTAERIRELTKRNDCSLLKETKLKKLLHHRKTKIVPDEYGGKIKHADRSLPPVTSRFLGYIPSENDVPTKDDYNPFRFLIYAEKSEAPSTLTQGKGSRGQRRPELCSSLPPAPPMVSFERSHFSQSLRGPLSRSILDTSLKSNV